MIRRPPRSTLFPTRRSPDPGNKPSRLELERCRPYLAGELRLLRRVRVVVTLGRIAHEAFLKAAGWWERLPPRSEEHTSELQSQSNLVCRLLLEKKKK